MNVPYWIDFFSARQAAHETAQCDWDLPRPDPLSPGTAALAESLAVFQLGESGNGTRLRKYAAALEQKHPAFQGYEQAVALFIAEEHGHAALLKKMVLRLGGTLKVKQWSNSAFRHIRTALGLEFNVQVLLSAELIARAYYGLLSRHAPDPVIRTACRGITHDEVGHIAFHVAFFRARLAELPAWQALLWRAQFRSLLILAILVVWKEHGVALRSCQISFQMFFGKTMNACQSFMKGVSRADLPHDRSCPVAPLTLH